MESFSPFILCVFFFIRESQAMLYLDSYFLYYDEGGEVDLNHKFK